MMDLNCFDCSVKLYNASDLLEHVQCFNFVWVSAQISLEGLSIPYSIESRLFLQKAMYKTMTNIDEFLSSSSLE